MQSGRGSVTTATRRGLAKRRGTLMDKAILLAVAASVCTATASLCQRKGARSTQAAGFDARLLVRLARQPAWLLGIAAMIGGFIFQITALRFGDLALVQPILAAELLFVFGYLAVAGTRRVTGRDLLAAAAMSAGIGVFLRLAAPSGGRLHAPGSSWLPAGPLAASQPGFTILDPLAASMLGVFLFGEHIRTDAAALAGEALALTVVIAGAAALSRSSLIADENAPPSRQHQPAPGSAASAPPATPPPPAPADLPLPGTSRTSRPPGITPDVAARVGRTAPGPAP